ncbi:ankyrin repeat domain-containing protein [Maritalea porphyrae]|uniref:ankyrin repeat domain-containing protein n=1 Tax=Maritalea porphyrae TaxID=880732 RepID=UPI0022AE648D|nr:ankyrin repeat domain-containing protein [Maritalea porphyrae]MCZ4274033.1 ankyrin repeat domain-containing protein [Maritalea porphyrae]
MRIILLLTILLSISACVQRMGVEPKIFQIVRNNDAAQLSALLDGGADANLVNGVGDPLIYVAAGPKGGLEVLLVLLRAGANPNVATPPGRTALHNAASWCTPQLVLALLNAGANPHLKTNDGRTALDATCKAPQNSRQQIIQILREAMSR